MFVNVFFLIVSPSVSFPYFIVSYFFSFFHLYYVVVLFASSNLDLLQALGRFGAKYEATVMKVSISKSEAMVLCQKRVDYPLWVRSESLLQEEEFKDRRVLFMSGIKEE